MPIGLFLGTRDHGEAMGIHSHRRHLIVGTQLAAEGRESVPFQTKGGNALRPPRRQKTHHQIRLVQIHANVPHITSPLVVVEGHEKEYTRCIVHPPIRARSPYYDAGEGSAGHTGKRGQLE